MDRGLHLVTLPGENTAGHMGHSWESQAITMQSRQARLWHFPQEGKGEVGQAGLGVAGLKNLSRLWDKGVILGCLTCPRAISLLAQWERGPKCETPTGEADEGCGLN